jgi:hypothetical protein
MEGWFWMMVVGAVVAVGFWCWKENKAVGVEAPKDDSEA